MDELIGQEGRNIDLRSTESWINRYIEADMMVSRRILADTREGIGVDLTREQYQVMCLINNNEQSTSTFLAENLFVGKSSITAIVNRMVEREWIERTRDEDDRRVVYLKLTNAGQAVHRQAKMHLQALVSSYLTYFDEREVEHFITLYEKLARLMHGHGGERVNENHT
ncbi:MarR family winged helix-turn-helix transcriptional regulator [Paenibacillus dakarensis]|uniref:MarR family winged helix-turn-helix transcriptional regulator n=1 Tax=Paenibacillus dakarensis TaxID=1527293 RepID=UPI0006D58A11|nr:MarR family transcriptional regulator [Paenibacillus dakarensis]